MSDDLKIYDNNGNEIPRWHGTEHTMTISSSFGGNGHTSTPSPLAQAEQVRELHFVPPSKSTPGFARRQKRALQLKRELQTEVTPEMIDNLVAFLADYVKAPTREEAESLIWDASQEDWDKMLGAITGGGTTEAAVPPQTSAT